MNLIAQNQVMLGIQTVQAHAETQKGERNSKLLKYKTKTEFLVSKMPAWKETEITDRPLHNVNLKTC
jgi:hypothetical protein